MTFNVNGTGNQQKTGIFLRILDAPARIEFREDDKAYPSSLQMRYAVKIVSDQGAVLFDKNDRIELDEQSNDTARELAKPDNSPRCCHLPWSENFLRTNIVFYHPVCLRMAR